MRPAGRTPAGTRARLRTAWQRARPEPLDLAALPEPARRAAVEGASRGMVRAVARVDGHLPAVAPAVGFWAAVYARYARHRGSVLAGGLAFFGLLSLVPAVIALGALLSVLYDPSEFAEALTTVVSQNPDLATALTPVVTWLEGLDGTDPLSWGLAGVVSLAVSLYAASRFVYVGRQVLDITFELEPRAPSLLGRGIAIVITLACQLILVLVVILAALVPRLLDALQIGQAVSDSIRGLRLPVVTLLVYLALTASMRYGIAARRTVRWANWGALVGAVVMLLGTLGLGWYLSVSATYSQIVAVLGGVIALELWLYVVALAIVAAAEIESVRMGFRRRDLGSAPLTG